MPIVSIERKVKALAVPCGIWMGLIILVDPNSATIFVGLLLALLVAAKYDNAAFKASFLVATVFALVSFIYFPDNMNYLGVLVVFVAAFADEKVNDMADQSKSQGLFWVRAASEAHLEGGHPWTLRDGPTLLLSLLLRFPGVRLRLFPGGELCQISGVQVCPSMTSSLSEGGLAGHRPPIISCKDRLDRGWPWSNGSKQRGSPIIIICAGKGYPKNGLKEIGHDLQGVIEQGIDHRCGALARRHGHRDQGQRCDHRQGPCSWTASVRSYEREGNGDTMTASSVSSRTGPVSRSI